MRSGFLVEDVEGGALWHVMCARGSHRPTPTCAPMPLTPLMCTHSQNSNPVSAAHHPLLTETWHLQPSLKPALCHLENSIVHAPCLISQNLPQGCWVGFIFPDKETGSEKFSNLPKVTQLVSNQVCLAQGLTLLCLIQSWIYQLL